MGGGALFEEPDKEEKNVEGKAVADFTILFAYTLQDCVKSSITYSVQTYFDFRTLVYCARIFWEGSMLNI